MKYTTAILALAASASAQDLSLFPECSLPCIIEGVGKATTCELTDFACVCANMEAVKGEATPCVMEQCGADVAMNQVLPATEQFCAGVGGGEDGDDTPAPATTTMTMTTTTEAAPSETPGDGEDDGENDDEPSPSMVTPGPSHMPGDPEPSETAWTTTTSVHTAGAAKAVVGSFGMVLLGAVAAL